MEIDLTFKYSCWDFLFTFGGLIFFLFDIAMDAWAVVTFYQEGAYIYLGLLLFFLLGSSALAQVYSWLWYRYDDYKTHTSVESCLNHHSIKILHVFQLGVYLRYAGVMDVSMRSFFTRMQDPQGVAVYLTHDLSMLRLIETFAESAPQLVLMLTIMLQEGSVDPITVLKAAGSALAIACSITMYHRSLRSFLLDKDQQKPFSSVVYWIWNVLLISPRVVAIALFATVLPCYIIAHFLSSWMILLICAWRAKTTFMDSACGERLYRATVALIWYFSWFNVAEGQTKYRSLLYNLYVMLDLVLLFGLSSWWIYRDPTRFKLPLASAVIISTASILGYILGLILKVIYYKFFHPKIARHQHTESGREGSPDVQERTCFRSMEDEVDLTLVTDGVDAEIMGHSVPDPPKPVLIKENKRMRKLAENFYS